MTKAEQAYQEIVDKRGGCVAVVVRAINGDDNDLEATIEPKLAEHCPCPACRKGDLTSG